jgi:predicted ATP-binding protein involved in virulence
VNEYFLQKLTIKDVRDIKDFEIQLDDNERKHLIITGKNGVGKTSLLDAIDNVFNRLINNGFAELSRLKSDIENHENYIQNLKRDIQNYEEQIKTQDIQKKQLLIDEINNKSQIEQLNSNIQSYQSNILNSKNNLEKSKNYITNWETQIDAYEKSLTLQFSNDSAIYENIVNGKFILALFRAKRENEQNSKYDPNVQINEKLTTNTDSLHKKFIQYMVKLRLFMLDAKEENETDEVNKIKNWFINLENSLKILFSEDDLELKYDRTNFNFKIAYGNKSFGLNELSDGYSSLLAIVTELILRMEAQSNKAYDMQGVVLIDEIETHLHVELQKKVLPFLVGFFPKIQFVVTTHSPFVLSSLSNAVICDLERKEIIDSERFVNASYSQIVKNYFEVDSEFSRVLFNEIKLYEDMVSLFEENKLDDKGQRELIDLDLKLDKISPMLSDEIYLRFKEAQGKIQNNG